MTIVFRPHIYKVRVFRPDQTYGDPYVGVMLVAWQGSDTVEIDLAKVDDLTRQDMLEVCEGLYALGVRTLRMWRENSHRMPFGRKVKTEGRFTLWEAELGPGISLLKGSKPN